MSERISFKQTHNYHLFTKQESKSSKIGGFLKKKNRKIEFKNFILN